MTIIQHTLRTARRAATALAALVACAMAAAVAAPAAFATNAPPPGVSGPAGTGPAPVRVITVGGTPGWQIAVAVIAVAVLAAAIAVFADRARPARRRQLGMDTH